MAPITLDIQSRSGRVIETLDVDTEDSVMELKKKMHGSKKSLYPSRQRYTLPPAPGQSRGVTLEDGKKISDYNLTTRAVLIFKDLGPQIGYATVFFWEYFGPMMIYPIFYFFPALCYPWYSGPFTRHLVQDIAVCYWCFHYAKRIFETYTVHRFGHATMPLFNLFRNCGYYWMAAAGVSFFINHPLYTPPPLTQSLACFGLALLCQTANYICHIMLASLRKPGEKDYKLPRGFLFNYITCPNYTVEICGWTLFSIATQTVAAGIFMAVGMFQMIPWAQQKHARLRKTFDGKDGREKYPRRYVILPPFL
jgi:very-long-chain enoyl-CoA reductase